MNAIPVLRRMKNMHHLPDDTILLEVEIEHLITYVNWLHNLTGNNISVDIHPDVWAGNYTIAAGLLLPFIKKAFTNQAYINRHRLIQVYLNANKTLLSVIVKTALEDAPANDSNYQPQFLTSHKLITNCMTG